MEEISLARGCWRSSSSKRVGRAGCRICACSSATGFWKKSVSRRGADGAAITGSPTDKLSARYLPNTGLFSVRLRANPLRRYHVFALLELAILVSLDPIRLARLATSRTSHARGADLRHRPPVCGDGSGRPGPSRVRSSLRNDGREGARPVSCDRRVGLACRATSWSRCFSELFG